MGQYSVMEEVVNAYLACFYVEDASFAVDRGVILRYFRFNGGRAR